LLPEEFGVKPSNYLDQMPKKKSRSKNGQQKVQKKPGVEREPPNFKKTWTRKVKILSIWAPKKPRSFYAGMGLGFKFQPPPNKSMKYIFLLRI